MMSPRQKQELYGLLNALCESTISDDEFDRLDLWLRSDKEVCQIYVDFALIWSDLQYFHASLYSQNNRSRTSIWEMISRPDSFTDSAIWKALAAAEKSAPAVEIPVPREPEILIQRVQREKIVRKISKSSLFSLLAVAAAIVLIFMFARFVPPNIRYEVATLADCIDAQWGDTTAPLEKGTRMMTGQNEFLLREGMVKLLFDNSVKVLIEAPAAFKLLAADHVKLCYGRLYTTVPKEAAGFTVSTDLARIVDLGTEFGIEADYAGDTSLHTIKGKTMLIAGKKSNPVNMEVSAGLAKRVSVDTQTISDVPCDKDLFVRDIDSANNMIWRGQAQSWNGYINWNVESGNWSDSTNWDAGAKPDGTRSIRLRKGSSSICTLNTIETPVNNRLTVSEGQTLNIENGGYMGCGWARFGWSTVNMTGNGTWLLNNEDLYIGYPVKGPCVCVWTMSDTSTIDINDDADDGEVLYISQDNATGTLKLIGSGVTVNCDQLYVGYPRNPGFAPYATLEYVMNAGGVSTIHVSYRIHLSTGAATAHLVLSAAEPLPKKKDLVLIETLGDAGIGGDGEFDTMNGGPATEGTSITLGGNQYTLTYRYEANGDGCRNDVALVLKKDLP